VFQPEGRRTRVGHREDLLDAALRCGVGLEDLCAGRGTCGKCKVIVRQGRELLRESPESAARLTDEDRSRAIRLACQTRPSGEGTIVLEIPPEAQRSIQRLQTSGWMPPVRLAPSVRLMPLGRGASTGILRRRGFRIGPRAARDIASRAIARRQGATCVVWDRTVLAAQDRQEPVCGMAFDIGSTKLAGFLLDLRSGETKATVSAPNPQISHGEDIMARLAFVRESPEGLAILREKLLETMNDLLRKACGQARVSPDRVYHVTAVGNTAMHHIFLGLPAGHLATAPYRPATRREIVRRAGPFGLKAHPEARIHAPPVVAGFVGSDLVAGVLATRMHRSGDLQAFVDIGTNTEICVGTRHRLVACSSPSGPAFEGAHIRFGMRAADGAIERVAVDPETLEVDYRIVGRGKPRGLCGSALLDLIADLFLAHVLDAAGRFQPRPGSTRIRLLGKERAFLVVPASEAAGRQDLVLTQTDVGQIQLAKAAVRSGIELLLATLDRTSAEIRRVFLAGAFGTYVAPESARTIGLFPEIPLDRVRFVGNTAGSGARLALLSRAERTEMRSLARTVEHLPLAEDPRFPRAFASALPIPHRNAIRPADTTPRAERDGAPRR